MHNQNRSSFFVPPHPDVPEETYHRVLARLSAENQARSKRLIKRSQRVGAVTGEYRRLAEDLLGKGKYQRLREHLAEARARRSRALMPPKGLELSREAIEQLAARQREEADAFLRKLGVKPEALGALNRRFQARMQKAARQPQPRQDNQGQAVDIKDVPAPIRRHRTSRWTERTPPFDGYNWFKWITQTSETLIYIEEAGTDFTDPATGRVGSKINVLGDVRLHHRVVIRGGDEDIAAANVEHYSSVGFWYRMDQAYLHEAQRGGQVEVRIEAEADTTQHRIDLDPYLGWSTAWVDQNNYITLRATGAGDPEEPLDIGNQAIGSRMVAFGTREVHWNNSWYDRGATVFTHQRSANQFPANRWMWIQIGTDSRMDVSVGQFNTDSDMDFKWVIKRVRIRASRPD